ncbi:MAG: hypothetical protein JXB47_02985, partial [Anaerolineae bacterium]|nr:hypothetical protein [Anaerolineae bacterium]
AARGAALRVSLHDGAAVIREATLDAPALRLGLAWRGLEVAPWYPNGKGEQPLYTLNVVLYDADGAEIDRATRRVGFKHVEWQPCEGAPPGADPWLCVVNGAPVFLQGVNWTPVRPNFADVTEANCRQRLETYKALGVNILRVWGGAVLEKAWFYDACDELGLMVWQEFPLSSSGTDNYAPDDPQSIAELAAVARSYIARRQHHVSLLLWCGGNELMNLPSPDNPFGRPLDLRHPMLRRFAEIVRAEDPARRFLPTSAQGPRFMANPLEFGQGVHWDVHGPWDVSGTIGLEWDEYWRKDDALFRAETGAPGASPVDIIEQYKGDCDVMPASFENPLWRRTSWWIEWPHYIKEHGKEPESLAAYVAWSQQRQRDALATAVGACKARFPRCGGIILWMGHDCFPCTANTAILDFHGRPKPAAEGLSKIWREREEEKKK